MAKLPRSNVSLSEESWAELKEASERRGVGWDMFFLLCLESKDVHVNMHEDAEENAPASDRDISPEQSIIDHRESSSLYPDFADGKLRGIVLYLDPSTIETIEQSGCNDDLDKIVETFLIQKLGNLKKPSERKRLLSTLPEEPEEGESAPSKKISSSDAGARSSEVPPSSFRYNPSDPKKLREATGHQEKSTSERRLLKAREKWIAEAKKYQEKPSESLAWPIGCKARLIFTENEPRKNEIRKIKGYFIYQLREENDQSFLEPYRLEFMIEKIKAPGEPERIDNNAFVVKNFQFRSKTAMQKVLKDKETVFEELA